MTTTTNKEKAAFAAHEVKISKTVYEIVKIEVATSESLFNVVIKHKNTVKNLSLVCGEWVLSTGRGLPKYVDVAFLQHEVISEFNA